MSSLPPTKSSASVSNILTLLSSRGAQLVAGASGLEHRVTWACRMRVRLPAFDIVQGGELALLTLAQLRRLDETLPHLLKTLHTAGVAAVAVAANSVEALGKDACSSADELHIPLILLPVAAQLEEIEREVIYFVVNFRGEIERQATEIAHHLMELSVQGFGIQGICSYLANSRGKWVLVQEADQRVRFQAAPAQSDVLLLPVPLKDEWLRQHGLTRVVEPIMIRHEVVAYLSLIGNECDFDYLERIILSKVVPLLALEVARERERSEVESRYQVEAFNDIIQGNYQQPEEMQSRVRLLGYDLTASQAVVVFEVSQNGMDDLASGVSSAQWGRRIREELLRVWPSCWVLGETQRVVALLPISDPDDNSTSDEREGDTSIYTRLERVFARLAPLQSNGHNAAGISCGIGRVARNLQGIPQAYREAQQALEIGRRLFGEGKLHSFARLGVYRLLFHLNGQTIDSQAGKRMQFTRLGVYRLLFHLNGQSELTDFYYETLGPLLTNDQRNDGPLIETLEGFFRCTCNLSETARAMHLHRNSLLYRLDRIESLLGRSLEDADLRLNLQIALKIHHLQKR